MYVSVCVYVRVPCLVCHLSSMVFVVFWVRQASAWLFLPFFKKGWGVCEDVWGVVSLFVLFLSPPTHTHKDPPKRRRRGRRRRRRRRRKKKTQKIMDGWMGISNRRMIPLKLAPVSSPFLSWPRSPGFRWPEASFASPRLPLDSAKLHQPAPTHKRKHNSHKYTHTHTHTHTNTYAHTHKRAQIHCTGM